MSDGLRDTVALVTGASSGIGEATARALAAQGAAMAVVARRKERLNALAAEIAGLAVKADVTDREQAAAAVERTVQELGRLDIVINNAVWRADGSAPAAASTSSPSTASEPSAKPCARRSRLAPSVRR